MDIQWKSFFIGIAAYLLFNFLMARFAGGSSMSRGKSSS